ncbi:hypothetical protein QOZ80_8BG0664540 [Eleusine coracana subsp. coracana]|nr:hypothetical protein QOZ80_8BG0664540 [Eleusine coracana subsp. coracana]
MGDESIPLPIDAFVEVLLRLPTSARRRFRLVCKRWSDVIDERTSEKQDDGLVLGNATLSVVTVANPITSETKVLPPVPTARDSFNSDIEVYSFGYHPTTGGDSGWREVAVPSALRRGCYHPLCGIVCVDGTAYWFTLGADRVMALDLKDERLTSFQGPSSTMHVRPVRCEFTASWKVTSVHGSLGVVVPHYDNPRVVTVEVWVLEGHVVVAGEQQA